MGQNHSLAMRLWVGYSTLMVEIWRNPSYLLSISSHLAEMFLGQYVS